MPEKIETPMTAEEWLDIGHSIPDDAICLEDKRRVYLALKGFEEWDSFSKLLLQRIDLFRAETALDVEDIKDA